MKNIYVVLICVVMAGAFTLAGYSIGLERRVDIIPSGNTVGQLLENQQQMNDKLDQLISILTGGAVE